MTFQERVKKGAARMRAFEDKKPNTVIPTKRQMKNKRVRKPLEEVFWPVKRRPKKRKVPAFCPANRA